MAKELYACIECGYESAKWMGRCTSCGNWNTFKKVDVSDKKAYRSNKKAPEAEIYKAGADYKVENIKRISTGFSEFDRVLGGGLVSGEVVLLGGEPGIGKTTVLLQVLFNLKRNKSKCVYVSAEESLEQVSVHIRRLGLEGKIDFVSENDIDSVISALESQKYNLVIIDSIQTVSTSDLAGIPGGVGQVKECAFRITNFAKKNNTACLLIGHITKDGDVAGPKVLEHIVDAVLFLEGDSTGTYRILKAIKNRFGSTREIGVFSFGEKGFSDAVNPMEMFIESQESKIGVCKGVILEGNRPLVVEVQSLVTKPTFSMPQRIVHGLSRAKIQMLCAVLSKYTKANLLNRDVYVNVASGFKTNDSSIDLAIAVALLSSYYELKNNSDTVALGEVSLTGQIFNNFISSDLLKNISKIGYRKILLPKNKNISSSKFYSFVDDISQLTKILR